MNKINNDFNNNVNKYTKIQTNNLDKDTLETNSSLKSNLDFKDEFISELDSSILMFLTDINENINLLENIIISFNVDLEGLNKEIELLESVMDGIKDIKIILEEGELNNKDKINIKINDIKILVEANMNDDSFQLINKELKEVLDYLIDLEDELLYIKKDSITEESNSVEKIAINERFNHKDESLESKFISKKDQDPIYIEKNSNENTTKDKNDKNSIGLNQNIDLEDNNSDEIKLLNNNETNFSSKSENDKNILDDLIVKLETKLTDLDEIKVNRDVIKKDLNEKIEYVKAVKNKEIDSLDIAKLNNIIKTIEKSEQTDRNKIDHLENKDKKMLQTNNILSILQSMYIRNSVQIGQFKIRFRNILIMILIFVGILIYTIITN